MRRAVAVLVLAGALLVTGCSPISAGYITAKDHTESYYTTERQCVAYDKNSICKQWMPYQQYHGPSWKFSIQQDDEKGWVYVNEDTYGRYEVGDYYGESESR